MPLSVNFTVSQSALSPAIISVEDTSTGSDVAVTQRRLYVQASDGTYLVPSGTSTDYIDWPLATDPLVVSILTEDIGCSITTQWLNVSGGVLYTLSRNYALAEFNKQYYYTLAEQLGLNPGVAQDTNFFTNMGNFWTFVTGGIQSVEVGDDIAACQNLFNMATNMRLNASYYF